MSENDRPHGAAKVEKELEKIEKLVEEVEELVEEVDLEIHAKAGKKPPKAKRYRIRVDDRYFVVTQPSMTGRQILVLAGKTPPENFILTEKSKGGALHTVELDEVVDFTKPGVERFNTLPRQVQEG
ncbi:MAG: multiubiquitin domain-containing protein [Verrucomicrobiota bacterium]|jgi:predicted ribosome quality control (RQC) complex YloA/Tae2 family protein